MATGSRRGRASWSRAASSCARGRLSRRARRARHETSDSPWACSDPGHGRGAHRLQEGAEAPPPPRPAFTMLVEPSAALDMVFSGTVQPQVQTPRRLPRDRPDDLPPGQCRRPGRKGRRRSPRIDPLALQMAARAAAADLASARAQFDNAASTAKPARPRCSRRRPPRRPTFDAAEQARARARRPIWSRPKPMLAKAREQLSYAVLKADYRRRSSPTTTPRSARPSRRASRSSTIAEPTRRDAVIDAPEQLIDDLRVGQPFDIALQTRPGAQGRRERCAKSRRRRTL